jgi:hypothetical protein
MSHDDFAFEPVPGLPSALPKGEAILWQGRPDTWRLAVEAFNLHWVAGWFALIALWRAATGFDLGGLPAALAFGLPYMGLGLLACAVLWVLAWAQARATVYTITTARVVMRIGAALSLTLQLPFLQIASASLDLRRGGTGTVALHIGQKDTRLAWTMLWPHARPWHFRAPEPALRCIPEAARVAKLLAEAAETRLAQPTVTRTDRGLAVVAAE